MTGFFARTLFKVCRDLGPSQLVETASGAAEISRRIDRRVIGTDQGDDITGDRRLPSRRFSMPTNPRFIAPSSSPTVLPAAPAPVIGVAKGSAVSSCRSGYETKPLPTRER